jgi:hypothetical protein
MHGRQLCVIGAGLSCLASAAALLALLAAWGDCPEPPEAYKADLDGDGVVGTADLFILLANWGAARSPAP